MKTSLLAVSVLLAAGACSGSTNSGTSTTGTTGSGSAATTGTGTGGTGGGLTITFPAGAVDIHPAAKAFYAQNGVTPPTLSAGSPYDAGYVLELQGLGLCTTPGCTSPIANTLLYSQVITNTGPYSFTFVPAGTGFVSTQNPDAGTLGRAAGLGVLAVIVPQLPDGGTATPPTGVTPGLPQPSCETALDLFYDAGASVELGAIASQDYVMPSAAQINGVVQPPTASVSNAVVYGVPMAWESVMNCAGGSTTSPKTTYDTDKGVALIYVTNGGLGIGSPLSGVDFALKCGGAACSGQPAMTYYASDFASNAGTATDATGVAANIGGVLSTSVPSVTASDTAGDTFSTQNLGWTANIIINVFPYQTN